jgi:hypothetical protein
VTEIFEVICRRVEKPDGRMSLKRHRRGLEDNIKTEIEGLECDIFDWIPLLRLGQTEASWEHGS